MVTRNVKNVFTRKDAGSFAQIKEFKIEDDLDLYKMCSSPSYLQEDTSEDDSGVGGLKVFDASFHYLHKKRKDLVTIDDRSFENQITPNQHQDQSP